MLRAGASDVFRDEFKMKNVFGRKKGNALKQHSSWGLQPTALKM